MEPEPLRGKARGRRGRRIARRIPLMIHWREPQGQWREIPAETRTLSRHGCRVACSARIKKHDEVMVWWLEKNRYAPAHVVFQVVSAGDDAVEIALEFLGSDDFWEIDFFHDTPLRSKSRSRSDDPAAVSAAKLRALDSSMPR
jgi:hypothetical protein